MATKNIVPRADGEGQLGTTAKAWGEVITDKVTLQEDLCDFNSLIVHREMVSLADDAEITLATGVSGWGEAMIGDNQEWARFRFTAAGVVTLLETSSIDVVNTDTDAKFCIYDAGSGIAIKNRLGSTLNCAIEVRYFS